jgi:hypothetical protein
MAKRTHEIDAVAVNEAILIVENDSSLYDRLIKIYLPAMQKKLVAGNYDPEKAIKLLENYYNLYCRPRLRGREYGWDPKFNPAERYEFAKYFRDYLYQEFLKPIEKLRPKAQKKPTLSESKSCSRVKGYKKPSTGKRVKTYARKKK